MNETMVAPLGGKAQVDHANEAGSSICQRIVERWTSVRVRNSLSKSPVCTEKSILQKQEARSLRGKAATSPLANRVV